MAIKCKIIFKRDPNTLKITDEIKAVKAPNGKRSLLFDSIKNVVGNDTESLKYYFFNNTQDFKKKIKVKEEFDPNHVSHPPVPLAHDEFVERAEWMKPVKNW